MTNTNNIPFYRPVSLLNWLLSPLYFSFLIILHSPDPSPNLIAPSNHQSGFKIPPHPDSRVVVYETASLWLTYLCSLGSGLFMSWIVDVRSLLWSCLKQRGRPSQVRTKCAMIRWMNPGYSLSVNDSFLSTKTALSSILQTKVIKASVISIGSGNWARSANLNLIDSLLLLCTRLLSQQSAASSEIACRKARPGLEKSFFVFQNASLNIWNIISVQFLVFGSSESRDVIFVSPAAALRLSPASTLSS